MFCQRRTFNTTRGLARLRFPAVVMIALMLSSIESTGHSGTFNAASTRYWFAGEVVYELKHSLCDGTTHILDHLSQRAPPVPPPRRAPPAPSSDDLFAASETFATLGDLVAGEVIPLLL